MMHFQVLQKPNHLTKCLKFQLPWQEENAQALVHCGKLKTNDGLHKIANDPDTKCTLICNKETNDALPSVAKTKSFDKVFKISIAVVRGE